MAAQKQIEQEQIDELSKGITDATAKHSASAGGDGKGVTALQIVEAWVEAGVSAFSKEELAAMKDVLSSIDQSIAARATRWEVPQGNANGRGAFIVFEGLDRSGKSTQSKLLTKHLEAQGSDVEWTCFPNRKTAMGCVIDLYLRKKLDLPDEVIHELFSANRWETVSSIVAFVMSGKTVICDRYAFSGVAYSAAKGLDFEWCKNPDRGLPAPDAIFYLMVDPSVGKSRACFGDERYENVTMQTNVRIEFQRSELRDSVDWHDVDGNRSIDTIHAEIRAVAEKVMEERRNSDVAQLWNQGGSNKRKLDE